MTFLFVYFNSKLRRAMSNQAHSKMHYIYLTCILVVLFNSYAVNADMTFQDPRFINRTLPTGQIFNKYDTSIFEPISGQLILNTSDVVGKIVYVPGISKPDFWTVIFILQNQGAIAVVFRAGSSIPGLAYCSYNAEEVLPDIVIPVVQVSKLDFDEDFFPIINSGGTLNITLTGGGNQWYDVYNSPTFTALFRGILGAISAALTVYATVVLAFFIKAQGSIFNIPQVCLGLEIIANLLRLLYVSVDPFGCFSNLQGITSNILESITLPLNVATFVLITFYWYEAITDASIRIYSFLSKLRIPFFVLTFTLIAVDFMFSFLDYYKGIKDTIPLMVIYLVISAAFLIFYLVTIVKIAKRMQRAAEMTGSKKKVSYLLQINKRMILGAIAKLILIVYAVIWAGLTSDTVTDGPVPTAIVWGILFLALMLDSFCRIWLFNLKSVISSSRSKKGTSNTASTRQRTATVDAVLSPGTPRGGRPELDVEN